MNFHELIFSDKTKYKVLRHILFCTSILLYSFLRIGIMYPVNTFWASFASYFSFTLFWTSLILGFSYVTVYVFVPKYLYKRKYVSFVVYMLLLITALHLINFTQSYYQVNKTFNNIAGIRTRDFFQSSYFIRLLGNPPLVCGLLLSLKSLKNWYLKKMENETLTRANTNAELQLLKSQIHPHFLFNTLNNIYSFSLSNKPEAAGLVKKLKQTVHYMVAECNHAYVPLKNELNMIANYIELEKIRYGTRLSMQVELMDPDGNHLIAPLLMIPFVENSFKHGVSQMLDHPRISLKIYAEGNTLYFFLSNSKPPESANQDLRKGIGLENVKKRLDLLYPGKHSLLILSTEDSFTVQMEISLSEYILLETESGSFQSTENTRNTPYAIQ
jgi:sensor histidine kinase YesM